jgi:hypothetical protein
MTHYTRSSRTIPVSIAPKNIVSSTSEKIDPKKQLREAGYPFSHIGQELIDLHGKFEVVSKDVLLLKTAITDETTKLSNKVDESQKTVLDKVETLFNQKFFQIVGVIVGCIPLTFATITFMRSHGITGDVQGWLALIVGLGILLVVYVLGRRATHS